MKKNKLGNTGIEVTDIGFGVLTVGNTQLNLPLEQGANLVRYGLEQGINFLDTAQYYETYPYIRKALEGTNFNPVIASKSLDYTYSGMEAAIEEARTELNRDVIDIFLLHEVRHDMDFENRVGAWSCLQEAKAKGLVKAVGVSTHHVDVAQQMSGVKECDILFPLINKDSLGVRFGDGQGKAEDMAAAIEANAKEGKGVFAMKVFGGGNLTGSYMDCMNYVSSLPGISSLMIGFGKEEEVDRAIEYAQGRINPSYVPDIGHKRINIDQGDCEGCGN
ncbi:MAG: aldo/keto reductase, partial [Anaerovoracaceae bacterium]